jgi:hypothetical protein
MFCSFKNASSNPLRAVKQASCRFQAYASVATDSPPITQTNREQSHSTMQLLSKRTRKGAEMSMKRFWKSTHVNAGEGRPSYTSQRVPSEFEPRISGSHIGWETIKDTEWKQTEAASAKENAGDADSQ